jgi:hypothetical protein
MVVVDVRHCVLPIIFPEKVAVIVCVPTERVFVVNHPCPFEFKVTCAIGAPLSETLIQAPFAPHVGGPTETVNVTGVK